MKTMIADNGDLLDVSKKGVEFRVIRKKYSYHFTRIENTQELKATLRAGEHTDLGGYPLFFITSDSGALSFDSVKENFRNVLDSVKKGINDGWRVMYCQVNYEGEIYDDHTGELIPSAYGED